MMVIPKTVNPTRLKQNQDSTKLKLSEEDMTRLTAVDKDFRLYRVSLNYELQLNRMLS